MYGPFVMSLEESDQFLNVLFLLEMLKYKQHQPSETNRTDKIKTSQGYRVFGFKIGGNGIGSFPQRVFSSKQLYRFEQKRISFFVVAVFMSQNILRVVLCAVATYDPFGSVRLNLQR